MKVKIYGAGSIGNHLTQASRAMGWGVTVCDVDSEALDRMKNDIYPTRYGAWDDSIELYLNDEAPRGEFDLIFIGTPPEHHIPLALDVVKEGPKAILIEKPLCPPDLEGAQELHEAIEEAGIIGVVGYDHVVGRATKKVEELLADQAVDDVLTLDVEFREHWGGIFAAHPWLSGPDDTYLGFSARGGGASGEHSHAANLWQHFAHVVGAGRVTEMQAMLNYVRDGEALYDSLCLMELKTESGMMGRVVQDVVTKPHRKQGRIQGTEGAIVWINGYSPKGDAVILERPGEEDEVFIIEKVRPDDFLWELQHLNGLLEGEIEESGIDLTRGLDTMLVVAGAHLSDKKGQRVGIDYDSYTLDALSLS